MGTLRHNRLVQVDKKAVGVDNNIDMAAMPSAIAATGCVASGVPRRSEERADELLSRWNEATEAVSPRDYGHYLHDGETRGFKALEALEYAFEKVLREIKETKVDGGAPAVWSVYNMGYVVKTREALFSIDLVHRRDVELASMLDFALVTHNHGDHWRQGFYSKMNGAGKTVISNFLDNYGVRDWKKNGGFTRAVKTFSIKDVEIRTSLIDHNEYLVDFTTAFEIKIGNFILYHTGDSGRGTEHKLGTSWGRPDLWLLFPGCGLNTAKAVAKVGAKRVVFGHLWELGHRQNHQGRLDEPLVRRALAAARPHCADTSFALWGDRIV